MLGLGAQGGLEDFRHRAGVGPLQQAARSAIRKQSRANILGRAAASLQARGTARDTTAGRKELVASGGLRQLCAQRVGPRHGAETHRCRGRLMGSKGKNRRPEEPETYAWPWPEHTRPIL